MNRYFRLTLISGIAFALLGIVSCSRIPEYSIEPVVDTEDASYVYFTSATLNGVIDNYERLKDFVSISEVGFMLGTTPNASTKIKGNFTSYYRSKFLSGVTNLYPRTTYYYKAYAITSVGTFYGDLESFETTSHW